MKRIKLLTLLAGPSGSLAPGDHEVSDKLAKDLVAAGCAEILPDEEPEPEKPEPKKELETADDKQEKREEAVKPRARRGRRRGR